MIDQGHTQYLGGNYKDALSHYSNAKETNPAEPMALYFIGCAQAKLDRHDEALSTLQALIAVVRETNSSIHARSLFMIAVIEEMSGDNAGVVEAWTEYKAFAEAHQNIRTFVSSATQRLSAYQARAEQEERYKPVRERISSKPEKN